MTLQEWLDKERIGGSSHGMECVGEAKLQQLWDAAQASGQAERDELRALLEMSAPHVYANAQAAHRLADAAPRRLPIDELVYRIRAAI